MISPHPSYPPLDMAHLGMLVVTNWFGVKELATWHENIRSVEELTADGVAATLRDVTDAFEADPGRGARGRPLRYDFLAEGPLFPFAAELAQRLSAGVLTARDPILPGIAQHTHRAEPLPMTVAAKSLDQLAIDTIRTLAIDGVQKANSGHPGAPMGAAPMAYMLWTRFLRHAPTRPDWPDRDRFVLSAGHARCSSTRCST